MSSAAIKAILIPAVATCMALTSCNGDKKAAEALREQAVAAIEASDPEGALLLLDSIDHAYPAQVETRRAAMPLRPKAIEIRTLRDLEVTDSMLVQAQVLMESMKDLVKLKKGSDGIDGYYVAASMADAVPSSAEGLYARMSPQGSFYIISSARKGTLSTGVTLSAQGVGEVSTPRVACDGERNDRSMSAELITFLPAECDTIGNFAFANSDRVLTLTFNGERQNRSITLPAAQAAALAQLYAASQVYSRVSLLALRKEKLERTLMLARSQQARTMPEQ